MARVEWDTDWFEPIEDAVHDFVSELAQDVYLSAVRNCPVKTGALVADLAWEVNGTTARIGAKSVPYAIFVEEGTAPHKIYPDTKEALYWEGAGHPRAMVNHPGATASHFLRRALYQERG